MQTPPSFLCLFILGGGSVIQATWWGVVNVDTAGHPALPHRDLGKCSSLTAGEREKRWRESLTLIKQCLVHMNLLLGRNMLSYHKSLCDGNSHLESDFCLAGHAGSQPWPAGGKGDSLAQGPCPVLLLHPFLKSQPPATFLALIQLFFLLQRHGFLYHRKTMMHI